MGPTASRIVDHETYPRGCPHRSRVRIALGSMQFAAGTTDLQTRFVCLAAGRLGLRAGKIAHFHAEWLDWDRMLLRIPQHEPCECGYCRQQATQETTHNEELTHTKRWKRGATQKQSPPRDPSQSISRFDWKCVWNGSPTSMRRFPGHPVL